MEHHELTAAFEELRPHLRRVAYRMLGSLTEADDAVQETWLRASRAGAHDVDNLGGWLTTITSRVCLDLLRARGARREQPLEPGLGEPAAAGVPDPEHEAVLADSVGLAMMVVLDRLDPAERLAFVLHDMFALPFDDIAAIVDRTPAATRQLASRARRRVQGAGLSPEADLSRKRRVVDAFLAASRGGDFEALLALLDPDVVLRADATVVKFGAEAVVRGPAAVAQTFSGRAQGAQLATFDGTLGLVWAMEGKPRVVFDFTVEDDLVVGIELVGDPEWLGQLDWSPVA
jgi:RNA polymerase sigma-70 factor (ECF subfamily)